jgi:hypothetical protein
MKDVYTAVDECVDNSASCEFNFLDSQAAPLLLTEFSDLSTVIHTHVHMFIFGKLHQKMTPAGSLGPKDPRETFMVLFRAITFDQP